MADSRRNAQLSSEKGLERLTLLKESLAGRDLSLASESDTRAKLITAILTRVLGWHELDITREENTSAGFTDYILSAQRRALVVEAKKFGDTFSIPSETKPNKAYKVGGILKTVPNLRAHIDQVSAYCAAAGIEYAVVTNGQQWLTFRGSRIDGYAVQDGILLLFNGLDDVEARFLDFWNLLSKPAVFAESLQKALHPSQASRQYRRIVDELHDRGDKVSRNTLSAAMTPLIQEYLQEITAYDNELLRRLYVTNSSLESAFASLEHRVSVALSQTVARQNISSESGKVEKIRASAEQRVVGALRRQKGEVVLLLGRVGSGKTTFVSHFLRVDLKKLLASHLLVHIDYRTLEPGKDLRQFFYENLRRALASHESFARLAGENVRKVYAPEIRELSIGPLSVLERTNKSKYEEKIAEFLEQQYINNVDQYYTRTLKYAAEKLGIRCLVVFDNVDQLDSESQQSIFTFAHSISAETLAISLLTMWEETFVRSKRSGALSTYATSGYALPQLSVVDILRKRLDFLERVS
jgi:predicted type IV restriction endonuclease